MKKKPTKPTGGKPARSRKITPQRARTERREKLGPLNSHQQVRTLIAKARFLIDFQLCGNVLRSAFAAGINRRTVYGWLASDSAFKDLYEQSHEDALDRLEEEARRRAVEGVLEPMVSQGTLVCHVRKYSDTLLITLLKGKRPDTYRERHEITGKNGGPVITKDQLSTLPPADLRAALLAAAESVPGCS